MGNRVKGMSIPESEIPYTVEKMTFCSTECHFLIPASSMHDYYNRHKMENEHVPKEKK